MNNLLSYYGLVDARISASEKDLLALWNKIVKLCDPRNKLAPLCTIKTDISHTIVTNVNGIYPDPIYILIHMFLL